MTNAIELHGLTKEYPGFRLGSLDLTLPSGSIMGLVGENGAGKSTTIKPVSYTHLDVYKRQTLYILPQYFFPVNLSYPLSFLNFL